MVFLCDYCMKRYENHLFYAFIEWYPRMSRLDNIQHKLDSELHPQHMHVADESHLHQRPGIESHFKIIAVSERFYGLSLLARHRLVYAWFTEEFNQGLHALSLYLYTPDEWQARTKEPETPVCAGKKIS